MIAKEELNILWSLEQTAEKYEDRVAVSDVNQEMTWKGLVKKAQVIGAELSKKVQPGNPIPVLLEKSSETLAVMLGKTEEEVEKEIWIPFQMITPDNADEYVDRY